MSRRNYFIVILLVLTYMPVWALLEDTLGIDGVGLAEQLALLRAGHVGRRADHPLTGPTEVSESVPPWVDHGLHCIFSLVSTTVPSTWLLSLSHIYYQLWIHTCCWHLALTSYYDWKIIPSRIILNHWGFYYSSLMTKTYQTCKNVPMYSHFTFQPIMCNFTNCFSLYLSTILLAEHTASGLTKWVWRSQGNPLVVSRKWLSDWLASYAS